MDHKRSDNMAAQLNQKKLSSLQIASFCTQLSLLIKAGISLQEGIHILYEDASSQAEKELLKQILEPIEEGQPLAFLSDRPTHFHSIWMKWWRSVKLPVNWKRFWIL